jgi:tetratricopeptide (TPR) repeat protein
MAAVALCLGLTLAAAQASDPADEAFAAGDYDRALALYDERLTRNPDDVDALVRSAQLLSWQSRFDEALARYDRALVLDPASPQARLERAKVLSWDGQLEPAVEAYRAYLDDHADDVDARVGLAATLSWLRRFEESRTEFQRGIEARPGNVDALVGMARTYAWSGELGEAREWYERALTVEPENKDARLGLAYLDLWSGAPELAARSAAELERAHPGDADVLELAQRARADSGPRAEARLEHIDDTDDNELDVLRLSGSLPVAPLRVGASYAHYDLANDPAGASASIDSFFVNAAWNLSRSQSLGLSLGVDRNDNDIDDERHTEPLGEAVYTWGLDRPFRITASAGRQALRYSPQITANDIRFDYVTLATTGRVGGGWTVFGSLGAADVTDDNDRIEANAGFDYPLRDEEPRLDLGATLRLLDYGEDTDSGYFDPQNFLSALGRVGTGGDFGARGYTWSAELQAGAQSFTLGGVETDHDLVTVVNGTLGAPLGRGFVLELRAGWGDYAAQTAGGFESREVALGLRWRGGSK